MATIIGGINPTQVDTVAQFPLGTVVEDPRGGAFSGNQIKYVRANASIAAGNVLIADVSFATVTERHATLISSSAVSQMIAGVNDITGATVASGSFFWATVRGRAQAKTSGVTAATNAKLGTSGTAGTLVAITAATPSNAEVIAAIAAGAGIGATAMTDTGSPVAGQSYVLLN